VQDLKRFQTLPAVLMLISNIARAGSQWILVWFYALLGGTSIVGEYTLALALATPIFIAFEMSLRNVFVTLHRPIPFATYLTVRLFAGLVAFSLLLALAGAVSVSFGVLVVIGLIKTADSLLDLSYGSLQKRAQITRIAWTSLLNSALSVSIGMSVYWLTRSIELSLIGSLIGSVSTAALVFAPVFRRERNDDARKVVTRADLKGILRAGVPSGLAFASVSLLTYLPIYFLGFSSGLNQVGIFAVVAYFLIFANLFYSSVQQTTLHSFVFHQKAGGNRSLLRYALRIGLSLLACGIVSGALTVAYGAEFITAVYGPDFYVSTRELLPIGVSMILLPAIHVSGAILLTKNQYGVQLVIGSVSLGLSAIVGVLSATNSSIETAGMLVLVGTSARAVLGIAAAGIVLKRPATPVIEFK
jgi:O-antigen/teichoic acid export membrane protein